MLASFVTCARCAHIQSEVFNPEEEARHPDHTRGEDCAFSMRGRRGCEQTNIAEGPSS